MSPEVKTTDFTQFIPLSQLTQIEKIGLATLVGGALEDDVISRPDDFRLTLRESRASLELGDYVLPVTDSSLLLEGEKASLVLPEPYVNTQTGVISLVNLSGKQTGKDRVSQLNSDDAPINVRTAFRQANDRMHTRLGEFEGNGFTRTSRGNPYEY